MQSIFYNNFIRSIIHKNIKSLRCTLETNIPCCCPRVAKLCPTVCDPMHRSTPSSSVLHYMESCELYDSLSTILQLTFLIKKNLIEGCTTSGQSCNQGWPDRPLGSIWVFLILGLFHSSAESCLIFVGADFVKPADECLDAFFRPLWTLFHPLLWKCS